MELSQIDLLGDSRCDYESLFEISCDKSQNEDGHNFQITMNFECVQERYPIIQEVGDFVNKYDISRNGQIFSKTLVINWLF